MSSASTSSSSSTSTSNHVPGVAAAAAATETTSEPDRLRPWAERWTERKLGWHQDEINENLKTHGQHLLPNFENGGGGGSDDKVRVFVPLCGKTVDMAFFANHSSVQQVVGVDGVAQALQEFAQEHAQLEIQPTAASTICDVATETETTTTTTTTSSAFERWTGQKIQLLKGDFFALNETETGGRFEAIWDRGSMVAIDPSLRLDYVQVLSRLIQPGGKILLAALERREGEEEAMKTGPPFSLSELDVRTAYAEQDWVESITLLEEKDVFASDPSYKERIPGITAFYELTFVIQAKA